MRNFFDPGLLQGLSWALSRKTRSHFHMLLIDTPFETMKSLVEEARNPEYREAALTFIREE